MSQHAIFATVVLDGNATVLSDLVSGSGTDVMFIAKSTNTDDVQMASAEADLADETTRVDLEPGRSIGIEGFNSIHNIWVDGTVGDKLQVVMRKI